MVAKAWETIHVTGSLPGHQGWAVPGPHARLVTPPAEAFGRPLSPAVLGQVQTHMGSQAPECLLQGPCP